MTFKEQLLVYIWNKSSQIDKEYQDTINHQRFRHLDENDYLEDIILKVRKDTFNEFVLDVMALMKLNDKGSSKKPPTKK